MARILWIDPVGTDRACAALQRELDSAKRAGTTVEVKALSRGPEHLEYRYYEALVLADTLALVGRAEQDGYDAAVIGCFLDPGLQEAREISERLVVTAPAESTMHLAATLGRSFSIIVGRQKWVPKMHDNVVLYGFSSRLASFRAIGLGVRDFQKDRKETACRLEEASRRAVVEDQAEVIILGCTMEFGFHKALQSKLGVPVLDPVIVPLKHAEHLVALRDGFGWSHSKVCTYQSPPWP